MLHTPFGYSDMPHPYDSHKRGLSRSHRSTPTIHQAKAAARAEQLKSLAQLQLKSLTAAESRPKLKLHLCCHAPKARPVSNK